ncbi:MAG: type III-A CRISPR-associated protein Csm2 [Candidatus Binataceae bacterium]
MPSDRDRDRRPPPRPDNRGQPPRTDTRSQPPPERPRRQQEVADVLSGDATKIDEIAERLAARLKGGINRSQIRNFYGPIAILRTKSDPEEQKRALRMHRSRLAYLVARAGGSANELWDLFGDLLKTAETRKQIDAVCDLAEAVVAYHRYYDQQTGTGTREERR